MPRTKKQNQEFTLNSVLTHRYTIEQPAGIATAVTIAFQDIELIRRFKECTPYQDIQTFVKCVVKDGLSWMRRMTNGTQQFELDTMDYWTYNADEETLTLLNPSKSLRGYEVVFSTRFTREPIDVHNENIGLILNSFWYKTHANPLAVVELIAATDLLFRKHHRGVSPAVASGVTQVNLAE